MNKTRLFYLAVFFACLSLLGFGLYLEHAKGIEPCPLCIFQRMAYIAVGIIAMIAAIHHPKHWGRYIYSGLFMTAAGIGAVIAGRQVWLQHLPPEKVPACGPGLEYILDTFPLFKALDMIFSGSGECAEVGWTFLGFSIAEWSLAWFLFFLIAAGYILTQAIKNKTVS